MAAFCAMTEDMGPIALGTQGALDFPVPHLWTGVPTHRVADTAEPVGAGRLHRLQDRAHDLMATTLGLAGCEIPVWSQGVDFALHLRGENFSPPEDVLLEMVGSPRWNLGMPDWRGLVSERWKYAFIENRIELLYDLESDPFEQHNLAREAPEECARQRQRLLELLRQTRDPYWDVLIEHGVACDEMVIDASPHPSRRLAYLDEN